MATQVEPVLLIGLGGTGREVLYRIRRRFFMAGYPTQPWISYLWIDTEASQPKAKVSQYLPPDYVTRKTTFGPDEICDIGVTQTQTTQVNNQKALWMNIWEWADIAAVAPALDQAGLTDGAKQQPPLGRLALFISAGKIVGALQNRLEQLRHEVIVNRMKTLSDELRFDVSATAATKVIFVGSLAGGTGAGCCIDIAAMLKTAATRDDVIPGLSQYNLKSATRKAYFLLPDAFINDANSTGWPAFNPDRVRANGYAMLQEIENLSLRRSGSGQGLTGREHAGQVHATWMDTTNLNKPWIDGPIYNNVFLFDGYGEGGLRLTDITDSYSLIANVLFYDVQGKNDAIKSAESNNEYVQSKGHIETCPQEATSYDDAIWSDVYSYVFATAGSAQLTFDLPRLKLTAAYMLAERAIRRWLGESAVEPKEDAAKAEHKRVIEQLRISLFTRLDLELKRKTSPKEGPAWSDTVRARTPWPSRDAVSEKTLPWSVRKAGFRIAQYLTNVDTAPPRWDSKALSDDLRRDYIGEGQRLPKLFLQLIDNRPLAGFDGGANAYPLKGGVRATEWLVQTDGLLEQKIAAMIADLKVRLENNRKSEKLMQAAAGSATRELDEELATLDLTEKSFAVLPGALSQLKERISKQFKTTQGVLEQYANAKYESGLLETMVQAWEQFRASGELKAVLDRQRARIAQTRFFLEDVLNRRRSGDGNLECGIAQILDDLRKSKWDHLTRVLRENLHNDENALWQEMKEYALRKDENGVGQLDDEFELVQTGCLSEWRNRLKRLSDLGQLAEAVPETFTSIVEFANYSAVPRQDQINDTKPDKIRLFDCLDALYEMAVKTNCVAKLLSRESINRYVLAEHLEFLERYSHCRLELHRLPNGKIYRADSMFQNQGRVIETPDEHRHLMAPTGFDPGNVLMRGSRPTRSVSNDPYEARMFRVELGIPLPAVKVLTMGAQAAAGVDPEKVHFFKPKSGYTPICRFEEPEAVALQKVYMHTVLAVILGQLRPGERPVETDSRDLSPWYFEYRISQDGRPKSYKSWRSVADIIRHLQRADGKDLLQEIVNKNQNMLRDMGPVALSALYLIVRYNLRWIAPEKVSFARITQALKDRGIADEEEPAKTKGPQVLVLEALLRFIGQQMDFRWQKKLDLGGELQSTIRVLEHFLLHFACFVPVNLRMPLGEQRQQSEMDTVALLCLNTEVVQSIDVPHEQEDLLLRTENFAGRRNPIFNRLALRAPWTVYAPGRNALTYERHRALTNSENTSMRPGDEGQVPNSLADIARDERLTREGTWDAMMYMSDAPAIDAQLYPTLLKSKNVVTSLDSMVEFMKRRMALAGGKVKPVTVAESIEQDEQRKEQEKEAAAKSSPPVKPVIVAPAAPAASVLVTLAAPAASAAPAIASYYVALNGVASKKALDPAEIVKAIQSGEMTPESKVWRKGISWMPAKDVPELAALFPSADDGPPPLPDDEGPPPLV